MCKSSSTLRTGLTLKTGRDGGKYYAYVVTRSGSLVCGYCGSATLSQALRICNVKYRKFLSQVVTCLAAEV